MSFVRHLVYELDWIENHVSGKKGSFVCKSGGDWTDRLTDAVARGLIFVETTQKTSS